MDEACHRRPSNGREQPSSSPGWKGTARVDRSVEEPGRPGGVGINRVRPNAVGEDITPRSGPERESDRPIVAAKRVTTVERRGLNGSMSR